MCAKIQHNMLSCVQAHADTWNIVHRGYSKHNENNSVETRPDGNPACIVRYPAGALQHLFAKSARFWSRARAVGSDRGARTVQPGKQRSVFSLSLKTTRLECLGLFPYNEET